MLDRRRFVAGSAALLPMAPALAGMATTSPTYSNTRGGPAIDKRSDANAPIVAALARHAVTARYEHLDAKTLSATKLRVLDLIGGASAAGNAGLVRVVAASQSKPEASIIGYPVRAYAADVAMTNAIIARSFDFEVMTAVIGDKAVPSHHSPTTCMTALALAERNHASGKQFLTSLAVGDDIAARLLVASGLDFGQGWDGSSVYSALAAVAIAARARELSPLQTQDAFGMAVDQIGGTIQNIWDGATDFKLPQGAVARNAILAVELAAQGWTGMGDALLAPFGFYAQYTAGCAAPQLLTADLGERFYAEAYFKPYPACMAAHPSIDCALTLRSRYELAPEHVAAVVVRLPETLLQNFCAKSFEIRRFPQADANFSFQFLVATALLRGALRQEHYEEQAIRSKEMARMLSKVTLERLPVGRTGVEIEVRTHDGDTLVETHGPLADRHPFVRPATRAQIIEKFHQQCVYSGRTTPGKAQRIIERIEALENETDMASFVSLVSR